MKTMMKFAGAAACLCLAISLTARAEEGSTTNAPAKKHHGGPGMHRGPGGGGGELGAANREEMEKFREKLKDMTPEQRQEAIKKFREKMAVKGGGEGSEQMRERFKNMTPEQRREAMQKMGEKMKERIEQSDKLTAEQKKEILAHMEKMKTEREKIMNDSNLTEEQKREALQKLREKAREMFEKHREALGGERPQHKGAPAKAGEKIKANPEQKQAIEAKPSV
jgi:Spy/CpxP family protein refolding chaperone